VSSEEEVLSLVERAKKSDPLALGKLYDLYIDKIYRYILYRVGNPTEAEDLAEQVFVKMLEAIAGYEPRGAPFGAWLFRIAHNLVVDHFRARAKRQEGEIDEGVVSIADSVNTLDPVEAILEHQHLRTAIALLTEEQQQVILLKFFGERSNAEIAQILNKTEGAIKSIQHRALRSLGRLLRKGQNHEQGY